MSSLHVPLGLSAGLGVVIARGFLLPAWVGVLVFLVFPLGAGLLGGLSFFALLELTICYTTEKSFGAWLTGLYMVNSGTSLVPYKKRYRHVTTVIDSLQGLKYLFFNTAQ